MSEYQNFEWGETEFSRKPRLRPSLKGFCEASRAYLHGILQNWINAVSNYYVALLKGLELNFDSFTQLCILNITASLEKNNLARCFL